MPSEVQILKESKARFEGVIFNQTADLGTNKSTSCKVIDEATGEVIAQSGGGGGESDFSTASVTFKNTSSDVYVTFCVPTSNEAVENVSPAHSFPELIVSSDRDSEVTVILYKGSCIGFALDEKYNIAVTGDITTEQGSVIITGDGTVTISDGPGA